MISGQDLRVWFSGFFAAMAVATFTAATVMRFRERGRRAKVQNTAAAPDDAAWTPDDTKIMRA